MHGLKDDDVLNQIVHRAFQQTNSTPAHPPVYPLTHTRARVLILVYRTARYDIVDGGVLHLMDTKLQEELKALMRRAYGPRFEYLVEEARRSSRHGHKHGCVCMHDTRK